MSSAVELTAAQQLLRSQKPLEAASALGPLLAREPDNIEALLLAGRIELALDSPAQAKPYLERAVKLSPKLATAQFLLGLCLYIDNDFKPALAALEAAVALKPNDGSTLLYLALTFEGLAQTNDALRVYPAAIARNPGAEAPLAFARFLFTLSRFDQAQAQVNESLRRDAKSREAHYEQARLHFEAGRYPQCAAAAELALTLPGSTATERPLHFLLARAYVKLDDNALAARHREAFERIPPRLVR